jgi:hypothetical protein
MSGHPYGTRPWSEMDINDLKYLVRQRAKLKSIGQFLCRNEDEVDAKVSELSLWKDRDKEW